MSKGWFVGCLESREPAHRDDVRALSTEARARCGASASGRSVLVEVSWDVCETGQRWCVTLVRELDGVFPSCGPRVRVFTCVRAASRRLGAFTGLTVLVSTKY